MEGVAHCVWKHNLDTKGPGISDEGDLFLLANGDCAETGIMKDDSGVERVYKEYWTSPKRVAGVETGKEVLVAEVKSGQGCRGLFIRVGGYAQGMFAREEDGRWVVGEVARWTMGGGGEWEADSRNGRVDRGRQNDEQSLKLQFTPVLGSGSSRKVGDEFEVASVIWQVSEAS
jgi:hypothetical protein